MVSLEPRNLFKEKLKSVIYIILWQLWILVIPVEVS